MFFCECGAKTTTMAFFVVTSDVHQYLLTYMSNIIWDLFSNKNIVWMMLFSGSWPDYEYTPGLDFTVSAVPEQLTLSFFWQIVQDILGCSSCLSHSIKLLVNISILKEITRTWRLPVLVWRVRFVVPLNFLTKTL